MNELLAAALRIVAPAGSQPATDDTLRAPLLPGGLDYAGSVRRFDPGADPIAALTHATAVAHLMRLHRTVRTLHGFAAPRGALDSEHLYQAHGEPRD